MLLVSKAGDKALRIFIRLAQPAICALLLMWTAHSVDAKEPPNSETNSGHISAFAPWHDGSVGGDYGIGEGWSLEILPADYETVLEGYTKGPPAGGIPFIRTPAVYEWVKDEGQDFGDEPVMKTELVTIPAEYMTVTETVIVKPEKTEYYLTDAIYDSDGTLETPSVVQERHIPAMTKDMPRRVTKLPPRTEERVVLSKRLERENGYVRILKTPAQNTENKSLYFGLQYSTKVTVAQPWRFLIKNPDGVIVHFFDDFEDLTAFVDSFK